MAFWNLTSWSLLRLAAGQGPRAARALNSLAAGYQKPVLRSLQEMLPDFHTAEDLAQEIMAGVFSPKGLSRVVQTSGRFRDYLRGAVLHKVLEYRKYQHRGCRDIRKNTGLEVAAEVPDSTTAIKTAEILTDRSLAMHCRENAREIIMSRFPFSGAFHLFWPHVIQAAEETQAVLANRCGISADLARQRVCQLRRHYRDAFRAEVQKLVIDPAELEEEFRYLWNLAGASRE